MKKALTLISIIMMLSMFLTACGAAPTPPLAPAATQPPAPTAVPPTAAPAATQPPAPTNTAAAGAAAPTATSAPAAAPTAAAVSTSDAFKYDPSAPVNNGKPITIKFWTWNGFDYLYKVWAQDYQKIHPNVTIDFSVQPWADYWKKLPLAITAGQGPDVYAMHNQQTSLIIDGNLAAPYPEEWKGPLEADFDFVDSHLINGNLYYIDSGVMSSMMFYNKKMWAAAGLTDADIPTTWAQVTAVAKKLTITDTSGKMTQEGFGLNGYSGYTVDMLAYQLGSYIYKDGGRQVTVDAAHKQALQQVIDWYDKDKVSSRDFPLNNESFAQGKTAMIYMWGWFNGYLVANNPDIQFGVFKLPTWDGKTPPAYDRNNGESTFSVNPKAPDDNKAVAFDFIHYCIDNAAYAKEMALKGSQAPVMKRIKNDPDLLADPAVSTTMLILDHTVWPGAFSTGWDPIKQKTIGDGIKTGMDAASILKLYEDQNNKDLANYKGVYWNQERTYKYASLMQP
jgi:multiple sugar transport system substrate-binding protein